MRWAALLVGLPLAALAADPRLLEVHYDPDTVVTVPVKRGVVTMLQLDGDESITELAAGLGGDCGKPDSAWCISAQPGGRSVFVKPRTSAREPNNLAIVTDRRLHSFRLVVLADRDPKPAAYRVQVLAPRPQPVAATRTDTPMPLPLPPMPAPPDPETLVHERLQASPQVLNTRYSLAEGEASDDIVPTLVFDDGRFTYFRFPGNREVPAVFQVLGDGSEALVNTRMEDELLVVDRVSRRLTLRAGSAVVAIWNDAFDLDGVPPADATTVLGVRRALRAKPTSSSAGGKP